MIPDLTTLLTMTHLLNRCISCAPNSRSCLSRESCLRRAQASFTSSRFSLIVTSSGCPSSSSCWDSVFTSVTCRQGQTTRYRLQADSERKYAWGEILYSTILFVYYSFGTCLLQLTSTQTLEKSTWILLIYWYNVHCSSIACSQRANYPETLIIS